jgi:hypothetical protein
MVTIILGTMLPPISLIARLVVVVRLPSFVPPIAVKGALLVLVAVIVAPLRRS